MKNIFKYSPGFLAGVILSSAFAGAAAANSNLITNTIDELWVFVAGDPVFASQVNENFEYLELKIDDNFEYLDLKIDEEVGFLSDDVIANTVSILNNEDGVGVNQSAISQVDSSLSSFQSSQSVRDGDQDTFLNSNDARISTLEGGGASGGDDVFAIHLETLSADTTYPLFSVPSGYSYEVLNIFHMSSIQSHPYPDVLFEVTDFLAGELSLFIDEVGDTFRVNGNVLHSVPGKAFLFKEGDALYYTTEPSVNSYYSTDFWLTIRRKQNV